VAKAISEALYLQSKSTALHSYKAIYLKIFLTALTILSRFIHLHVILIFLAINVFLLLYVGAKRILATVFALWCMLTSAIILLDMIFTTLTIDVILNLVYGFTTFTSIIFFYVTTPPTQIRKFVGFNAVSLTYLFFGYSVKLVADLIDTVKARGWVYSYNPIKYRYLLRAFTVLLISRISEIVDALRARGVEE